MGVFLKVKMVVLKATKNLAIENLNNLGINFNLKIIFNPKIINLFIDRLKNVEKN